jgi:hypothetical protein
MILPVQEVLSCPVILTVMKVFLSLILVSLVGLLYAQPVQKAVEDKNLNLNERYKEMKAGSQTFKDYKVIKETVLDKVWKITSDSIANKEKQLAEAEEQITNLKNELNTTRAAIEAKEASMKDIIYDSTHISVLGIPFTKGFFILLAAAVIGALTVVLSIAFARVKIANSLVKEKTVIADSTVLEFEDFKKKSMEKQTKLSRELQNERNKWQEYRKL